MLKDVSGKPLTRVPHGEAFAAYLRRLGTDRTDEVRLALNELIDGLEPDGETQKRTFNTSHLGSKITPWPYPIAHLYDVAGEILGPNATEDEIEEEAALMFGLFMWECVIGRDEEWVVWDPNLNSRDPNREIIGKTYFEQ